MRSQPKAAEAARAMMSRMSVFFMYVLLLDFHYFTGLDLVAGLHPQQIDAGGKPVALIVKAVPDQVISGLGGLSIQGLDQLTFKVVDPGVEFRGIFQRDRDPDFSGKGIGSGADAGNGGEDLVLVRCPDSKAALGREGR